MLYFSASRYDYFEETFLDLENASYWKAAFSVMIMLFSFCSVTPHYFLNFLSIFLCAVATVSPSKGAINCATFLITLF
jgi:hypothetical protein